MLKMIIDNRIAKTLACGKVTTIAHSLRLDSNHSLNFRWPSLLNYLGLESVVIPVFDQTPEFFQAYVRALHTHEEKDFLYGAFDQLFAENLSHIKTLTQIQPAALYQSIHNRQKSEVTEVENALSLTFATYEKSLIDNTSATLHDLILYLAWDRMCVCVSRLFDYQSLDENFINGLKVFKECLIESYFHITQQGHASPSFYRLIESLVAYYMRDEHLQKLAPIEWSILSQSFPSLKGQDELADFFYIDDAFLKTLLSESYLTFDSPDKIEARFSLAHIMIDKLKVEYPKFFQSVSVRSIQINTYSAFNSVQFIAMS